MKTKAVFLFHFANDEQHSLDLPEEWRQVEKALQTAIDSDRIIFNLTPSSKQEDLWEKFHRFHNQIAIFHYGGHSNGVGLDLTDVSVKEKNLATLLGQEKELKLAFLNGCSNEEQLEVLFEKGVPAVIATSAAIHDQRAIDLSTQFYQALASGRNIKESFELAAAYVNNGEKEPLINIRPRGFEREEMPESFEWGLYVKDPRVLNWKIPEASEQNKPKGSMNIHNYGNIGKQINIENNSGDLHF